MRRFYHLRCLVLLLILLGFTFFTPPLAAAQDPLHGPWNSPRYKSHSQKQTATQESTSIASPFFTSLLTFFSKAISPVDGDRCPSYPTCAAYSKEAFKKNGAFLGTLMTVDRLLHEADEAKFSPTVNVYGVSRIYDPVSANEIWKRKP
jgi:putative component of membrane protein insertase Oxa1/YidC/SpoIIIJ protein YidD